MSTSIQSFPKLNSDSTAESSPSIKSSSSSSEACLALYHRYQGLLKHNSEERLDAWVFPERRTANMSTSCSTKTCEAMKKAEIIADDNILKTASMRFLGNSPFLRVEYTWGMFETVYKMMPHVMFDEIEVTEKAINGIAITKEGRHVILQQAKASCVPTCVAMLVLDHGKKPNYKAIQDTNCYVEDECALEWIAEAGLHPIVSEFTSFSEAIPQLKKYGSAIVTMLRHAHVVILDSISEEDQTATLRDPLHGWSITISWETLAKEICPGKLIQVVEKQSEMAEPITPCIQSSGPPLLSKSEVGTSIPRKIYHFFQGFFQNPPDAPCDFFFLS